MLSIAPISYRNVLSRNGGPVERLISCEVDWQGKPEYQVNAFLKEEFRRKKPMGTVYSDADGTGTHATQMIASHIAISESLERWAFRQCRKAGNYGFDVDPTSNGMAAFPGIFARQSRSFALAEAKERFCLMAWWMGRYRAEVIRSGIEHAIRLRAPGGGYVAILTRSGITYRSYGTGGGRTWTLALARARLEMVRNQRQVGRFLEKHPGFDFSQVPSLPFFRDRRVLHYALDGQAEFWEKLQHSVTFEGPDMAPKKVFDAEIKGPWSRYARVWRVCYEPPNPDHMNQDKMYLFA